jgi:hypothetical protein
MATKRMGGMSLGSFSKSSAPAGQPEAKLKVQPEAPKTAVKPAVKTAATKQATPKRTPKVAKSEVLVTVNIKITESQQEWLADTAKQVRRNNDDPVAANERVYPQHLIQAAIDVLKSADVDWAEVKNISDLRQALGL